MVLLIDIGNTNVVIGVYEDDRLLFVSRFSSLHVSTADEFAVTLKSLLSIYNIDSKQIDGSIISSVVPQITRYFVGGIELILGKTPKVVGPGLKTGINIKIDNPAQLGSDLLVDSVAAAAKYQKPCIVIDMGTATTLSVVTENNEFIGGAIIPGVKISLDALSSKTAQLPASPLTLRRGQSAKTRWSVCSPVSFTATPACWTE